MPKLDNKKIPKKNLNLLQDLINNSKWPQGIIMVNDLLKEYPRSHELYTCKAICLSYLNKFDQAKESLESSKEFGSKLSEYKANISELYSTIGNYHYNKNEYEDSLDAFIKSLEGSSNPSVHLSNIGNVLIKLGRREEANQYYIKSIESNNKNPIAHSNLANSLIEIKEYKLALKPAEKCHELDDIQPFYVITLGRVLLGLNRYDDALKVFNKLKMIAPNVPSSYYFIVNTLLKLKKYEEIINVLKSVDGLLKDQADLVNILGVAYLESNEIEKSIDLFNEAKVIDAKNSASYLNLSNAYKKKGMDKESQIAFDEYKKIIK